MSIGEDTKFLLKKGIAGNLQPQLAVSYDKSLLLKMDNICRKLRQSAVTYGGLFDKMFVSFVLVYGFV
ncbi:hypothetical protein HanHA300_Chr16g0595461 [Helianthus annuus]|nr:hypothetical protein HanHA300_Chr16g0595461 [Helianthus annuus]KAJ0459170.1 hypothetical protein HanHA89_Chr16g0645881 [Helianthus annuus]KAJ0639726.1 hypothetical protein HanLR1_Chr16g0607011 [Helianthus annuus]